MPVGPGWTAAEDQKLIELWREHTSFAQMSWEFPGRTRNACIGRLTRLRKRLGTDVVPEGRSVKPATSVKRKRNRRKPVYNINERSELAIAAPTPIRMPPAPPAARRIPLLELGSKDCRFIVTDHHTREHLYCAVDASAFVDQYGNDCYCAFHRRIMRVNSVGR